MCVNLLKKIEINNIKLTIINWPISNPTLNDKRGKTTLISFPNRDFKRYEKPIPCIKPNKSAIV